MPVRVLIFHGYLLGGTGSNVYNASLAQALSRLGHEVHLLCQDREAERLEWVNAVGRWKGGSLAVSKVRDPDRDGSVTVYNPDIGSVLPVYVADRYEGFEAKVFPDLSDEELDHYLAANVGAVSDVCEAAGAPEAALANHLVMGPLILARSGLPFAAKVHGSALEYTVKPNRRFVPHAEEGINAASGVLVGSRHTAESLWRLLPDPALHAKTRLGPPGVNTAAFAPLGGEAEAAERLARLLSGLGAAATEGQGRDPAAAVSAIEDWIAGSDARVVFVGKLIVSKGVDLLLSAWPLVHAANPGARLLIVGFGAYEDGLRRLLAALESGDLSDAREVAAKGWGLEGGGEEPLSILSAFLESPPPGYAEAARDASGSISWAGRLEHDEVAELLPHADALVMPSTFPEAFGMVAAEAAASGALSISADHSGMREVAVQLATALPGELADLVSFPVAPGAVEELASRLDRWLELPEQERIGLGRRLAARVHELWSWERVADGVIAAAQGRLEGLPRVPED
jgi:glycosyltransferase involved in cell wall biosynthesis